MKQYQARINEQVHIFSPAQLAALDLVATGPNNYHLLRDRQSYQVTLLGIDRDTKQVRLRLNGKEHLITIRDEIDQLVDRLGFSAAASQQSNDVFAPMPGLVLDVMVSPGDAVEAGTPLLILEAMKMENVLKAEGEGTVKAITVGEGDAVDKRQLLIEIE
ncbi:MAG: biotin/lipoyl-containing protein [Bacteroidota bacterium]